MSAEQPPVDDKAGSWDKYFYAAAPFLLPLLALLIVAVFLRGDVPWSTTLAVFAVSALASHALFRLVAFTRFGVVVIAVGVLVGALIVARVLDRPEWTGIYFFGYLTGPLVLSPKRPDKTP